MEIREIKYLPSGNLELLLYTDDGEFWASMTFTHSMMWKIHDFCRDELSAEAANKKIKESLLK